MAISLATRVSSPKKMAGCQLLAGSAQRNINDTNPVLTVLIQYAIQSPHVRFSNFVEKATTLHCSVLSNNYLFVCVNNNI